MPSTPAPELATFFATSLNISFGNAAAGLPDGPRPAGAVQEAPEQHPGIHRRRRGGTHGRNGKAGWGRGKNW